MDFQMSHNERLMEQICRLYAVLRRGPGMGGEGGKGGRPSAQNRILLMLGESDGISQRDMTTLLRLRPQFNEKNYGCGTFGKLLSKLSSKYGTFRMRNDSYNVMVSLAPDPAASTSPDVQPLNRDTWRSIFSTQLERYKDDGFERINPSILKADITSAYPDFSEKSIGFKRFSDVLKQMERDGLLKLEMDGQKNMLIKMM